MGRVNEEVVSGDRVYKRLLIERGVLLGVLQHWDQQIIRNHHRLPNEQVLLDPTQDTRIRKVKEKRVLNIRQLYHPAAIVRAITEILSNPHVILE